MNDKLEELEKGMLTDLRKERLKNIKESETLPEGFDIPKFMRKVKAFSKYTDYIVTDKEKIEELAGKKNFIVNKGTVSTKKVINCPSGWDISPEDRESIESALVIVQRDMQISFAEELDKYLDENPSIKVANTFFVGFETLRWNNGLGWDNFLGDPALAYRFLLRFNVYVD